MQAYVARMLNNKIFDNYGVITVGYIVDKVEVLEMIKTFNPETNECLATTWKVKFINYENLDKNSIEEVKLISFNEIECYKTVDILNISLESKRKKLRYTDEELQEIRDYLREYQQLACQNWDKEDTL